MMTQTSVQIQKRGIVFFSLISIIGQLFAHLPVKNNFELNNFYFEGNRLPVLNEVQTE